MSAEQQFVQAQEEIEELMEKRGVNAAMKKSQTMLVVFLFSVLIWLAVSLFYPRNATEALINQNPHLLIAIVLLTVLVIVLRLAQLRVQNTDMTRLERELTAHLYDQNLDEATVTKQVRSTFVFKSTTFDKLIYAAGAVMLVVAVADFVTADMIDFWRLFIYLTCALVFAAGMLWNNATFDSGLKQAQVALSMERIAKDVAFRPEVAKEIAEDPEAFSKKIEAEEAEEQL